MNSKTKIVVLRMKELIYTGIFVLLGILLILLLVTMFAPGKKDAGKTGAGNNTETGTETGSENMHTGGTAQAVQYRPGVYTSSIMLGGNAIDLEVTVEKDYIASIRLVNLDETITTMYPLMEPALENLTTQIYSSQSLENITYPEENQYTSLVILDAIENAVAKARLTEATPSGE